MNLKLTYYLLLILTLTSCLKEETPLPMPEPGNIETVVIEIGFPYLNQVYYDCETNKVMATNTKYVWDLAFECTPLGYRVLLNNATGMLAANMGNVSFSSVNSTSGVTWLWDNPNGNLDSTAIGNWVGTNNIYIVDRQYDDNGNHRGYKKIQFLSVDNNSFSFIYANLDGSNENTYTVYKNSTINFIHFSFDNGGQTLALEPEKNSWDLLFTNHHHKFDNLTLPFVLTQALTNKHNGVLVAEDNNSNFFKITLQDTSNYTFTNYWNEIGHDWKIRNSSDNSFTIDEKKSYILKTTKGLYYKIRFIDFYNNSGEKGYPTFEIQKL
ncbi:MAG TPA: HmuY family protein [Vicingus sp.]|nr:HmuY family protein [Vicingus sp.]